MIASNVVEINNQKITLPCRLLEIKKKLGLTYQYYNVYDETNKGVMETVYGNYYCVGPGKIGYTDLSLQVDENHPSEMGNIRLYSMNIKENFTIPDDTYVFAMAINNDKGKNYSTNASANTFNIEGITTFTENNINSILQKKGYNLADINILKKKYEVDDNCKMWTNEDTSSISKNIEQYKECQEERGVLFLQTLLNGGVHTEYYEYGEIKALTYSLGVKCLKSTQITSKDVKKLSIAVDGKYIDLPCSVKELSDKTGYSYDNITDYVDDNSILDITYSGNNQSFIGRCYVTDSQNIDNAKVYSIKIISDTDIRNIKINDVNPTLENISNICGLYSHFNGAENGKYFYGNYFWLNYAKGKEQDISDFSYVSDSEETSYDVDAPNKYIVDAIDQYGGVYATFTTPKSDPQDVDNMKTCTLCYSVGYDNI